MVEALSVAPGAHNSFPRCILTALPSCGFAAPLTRTPVYLHCTVPPPGSPVLQGFHITAMFVVLLDAALITPLCPNQAFVVPGWLLKDQSPFSGIQETPCYGAKSPPPLGASPLAYLYLVVLQAAHMAP